MLNDQKGRKEEIEKQNKTEETNISMAVLNPRISIAILSMNRLSFPNEREKLDKLDKKKTLLLSTGDNLRKQR